MHKMHLTTCRLCGCVSDIRNLSGRQASKTPLLGGIAYFLFETSQADRHRKLFFFKAQKKADSKPLRPTGIENRRKTQVGTRKIRNLSGRQASKTTPSCGIPRYRFETSQADRHRKPRETPFAFFVNSKPLRPTGIENPLQSALGGATIRNLSGRQASKTQITFCLFFAQFETSQADRHRKLPQTPCRVRRIRNHSGR